MSNIVIVGFKQRKAANIRMQVEKIIKRLGLSGDTITTITPAQTKWCNKRAPAPYLIVRHTVGAMALHIAKAIQMKLKLDVEYETVGFISADESADLN